MQREVKLTIIFAFCVYWGFAVSALVEAKELKTIGDREVHYSWKASYPPSEEEPDYSAAPIIITVVPSKNEYLFGEPVLLKITFKNDAKSSFALSVSHIEDCWLVTYVQDTHRNIINYGNYNYSTFPIRKDMILEPGEFFYTWRYLTWGNVKPNHNKHTFDAPGEYLVWAEYYSTELKGLVVPSPKHSIIIKPLPESEEDAFKLFYGLDYVPTKLPNDVKEKRKENKKFGAMYYFWQHFSEQASASANSDILLRLKQLIRAYPYSIFTRYARLIVSADLLSRYEYTRKSKVEEVLDAIEELNSLRDLKEFSLLDDLVVKLIVRSREYLGNKEEAKALWNEHINKQQGKFSRIKKDNGRFTPTKKIEYAK